VTKQALELFSTNLFVGLFFIFGLQYGIDPSNIEFAIVTQFILALWPGAGPYLNVIGFVLTVLSVLGFIGLIRIQWDDDWKNGVAVFSGLIAGGLALPDVYLSIPFWVIGMIVVALP
jgi:hypothetical protein